MLSAAASQASGQTALELRGISKHFGVVRALDGADLTVQYGSIHGLVGENGAGKSTLIKVLAGIHTPDAGTIRVGGVAYAGFTPRQIEQAGVHVIHQERMLPGSFTVGEALFMGHELHGGPFVRRRAQEREAARLLETYFGLQLPAKALIRELSSAQQQVVQITRALLAKPRVIIFDEPSVALVQREVIQLLQMVRRLRDEGLAIVYISHYLQEIESLCDTVTVLRNGRHVAQLDPRTTPPYQIAQLMVNRDVGEMYPKTVVARGAPVLALRDLHLRGAYRHINLDVHAGEIVGLTGLVGSGVKELVRSIFGLLAPDGGEIVLHGRALAVRSPAHAVRQGIALLPEERRRQGVALDLSVLENSTMASLHRWTRWGWLSRQQERRETGRLIAKLGIKTPSPDAAVRALSGGNQQKVALAKWLSCRSKLYLLDEPSVGIDIAAKVEIYRLIGQLVQDGAAVLILSSDLPELLGLSDRIVVMHRGEIAGEFHPQDTDSDRILACATGASPSPSASTAASTSALTSTSTHEELADALHGCHASFG